MDNNELLDDDFEADDIDDSDDMAEQPKTTFNLDARRRLELLKEQREMERLLKDDFDFLDDIA